jgi:hypothetical protein
MALLRHMLAATALGVLEEGCEGAALLLSLGRCVEGRKRVLMLASLALRRYHREASGQANIWLRRCSATTIAALAGRQHAPPRA